MSEPHNRSLGLALGRLRFAVVTSCWVIALSLLTQLLVWSLSTFTELRHSGATSESDTPLVVGGDEAASTDKDRKKSGRVASSADRGDKEGKWRPGEEPAPAEQALGTFDRIFRIAVNVSRTVGLMAALIICPLLSLGMLLAVPAGAPRVERAVNALTRSIVLVLLAMPLGGWFGLAWQQGTISSYEAMMEAVEAARANGLGPEFFARFLLLPAASAVGIVLVGLQFSSAVEAVLLKGDPAYDPELEKEASNVAATSLHGTGRTAGALSRALHDTKAAKQARKRAAEQVTKTAAGDMPKRLI